jgi:cell division septum initiation protein DivIVA
MIDQLAHSLNRGWRIPLSSRSIIDGEEFAHLLERIRINVPSSIMESERTLAERDFILQEARAEAAHLLQQAKERAAELLSEQSIVRAAQQEAERIVEESRLMAKRRADEADQYAMRVLGDLAQRLQSITKQVDNGLQIMQQNRLPDPDNPPSTE